MQVIDDKETLARSIQKQLAQEAAKPSKDRDKKKISDLLVQFRDAECFKVFGFKSMHAYVKGHCPIKSANNYLPSKKPRKKVLKAISESEAIEIAMEAAELEKQDAWPAMPDLPDPSVVRDLRGQPITGAVAELFEFSRPKFQELYDHLAAITNLVNELIIESAGAEMLARNVALSAYLSETLKILERSEPYTVCTFCSGNRNRCNACKGHGFLTREKFSEYTKQPA